MPTKQMLEQELRTIEMDMIKLDQMEMNIADKDRYNVLHERKERIEKILNEK